MQSGAAVRNGLVCIFCLRLRAGYPLSPIALRGAALLALAALRQKGVTESHSQNAEQVAPMLHLTPWPRPPLARMRCAACQACTSKNRKREQALQHYRTWECQDMAANSKDAFWFLDTDEAGELPRAALLRPPPSASCSGAPGAAGRAKPDSTERRTPLVPRLRIRWFLPACVGARTAEPRWRREASRRVRTSSTRRQCA